MTDVTSTHQPATDQDQDQDQSLPVDFWEDFYRRDDQIWSGRVNVALADVVGPLPAGRALDLGSGEGADVLWLASQGWDATGVDISPTAAERATAAAAAAGVTGARYLAADLTYLAHLPDQGPYDLVCASFLHSPVELARTSILQTAATMVVPGGHLLLITHAVAPPWADPSEAGHHRFLTPAEEIDALALDPQAWEVVLAETRPRSITRPDGEPAEIEDGVILMRRR